MKETVALIMEYVRNDDTVEDDFISIKEAMKNIDTSKLKPTSTMNRLLINTGRYVDAQPGEEARKFYHKMEEEVALIESGI